MILPETMIQLLRNEGRDVAMSEAGEFLEDVDGLPLGIGPSTTTTGTLGPVIATADEWEATARHLLALLDGMPIDA